jgi:hypothetical protein
LSNEHDSQLKDQGRWQYCPNKHNISLSTYTWCIFTFLTRLVVYSLSTQTQGVPQQSVYRTNTWKYVCHIWKLKLQMILESIHKLNRLFIFMFWWRIDSDLGMNLKFMMATQGLK